MDEQKIIKIEKEITATNRLQSLKIPRDLSLKRKKQYAPNVNVTRNKDKSKEFLKKNESKRKERGPNPRVKHERDNNRFVQSTSVFSQGAGDIKPRISSSSSSYDSSSSINQLRPPSIHRNSWPKAEKKEEFLKNDHNCDIQSEDEDDDDDDKSSFSALYLNPKKSVKTENIKQEPTDDKSEIFNDNIPAPFNSNCFDDENPALGLVKLPDSFAGKGLSDDPNCKKLFDYPLEGMLEGKIGKLIIRQSGRMEIEIGKVRYHFEPENMNESKEQLATIVKSDNDESNLALLGNISHNFVMYPDYEQF